MSENWTAVDRQRADVETPAVTQPELPRPWGFWSTLCWALFACGLGGGLSLLSWIQPPGSPDIHEDPWLPLQLIIINVVQVAVLAVAARLAGWPIGRYLGLVRPRARDLLAGIAALALVVVALEILTHVLQRESVTPFQTEAYRAARAAGLLPLMWGAFVIAAPVGEEILFRGFVFRGWAASRLGVAGTILLTSLIFSALHMAQYDWFGVFQTFCIGALFGWLRWHSGSTTVTILLHMGVNLISTLWAATKVEGWV
jgi:membrane protease YdiL (CAAX protease family)